MRLAALLLLAAPALAAQEFEVASLKPSDPSAIGNTFNYTAGGGLTIRNSTLRAIIQSAYDVPGFQIQGGPAWMNADRFDIFAKSSAGDGTAVRETRRKLQALIAQRFQLQVHRETRDLPVYHLVTAKNGPKLAPGVERKGEPEGMHMSCGRMVGTNATMENFARSLARELARPVEDHTGLAAKFDFHIDFTPDDGACQGAPDNPSIFGALEGQVGLRLESARGPVEVIVVDHAEKPAGN